MKKIIATTFLQLIFFSADAQKDAETEIRNLENVLKEAFLKKDTATLFKLYAPDFVVNAPNNKTVTLRELKLMLRNGEVDRDMFEKVIEKVNFINNIAIVMGNETLHPTGKMPDAGKIVKRRYTNIWMKTKKTWQLVARQSTIISVE